MLADEEREDPVMNVPDGSYSRSASSVPGGVVSAGQAGEPDRRRWFVLGVVWLAQLMIVLDSRTHLLTHRYRVFRAGRWCEIDHN
jgi:hypothetical protein